jgi:hypothetical protein
MKIGVKVVGKLFQNIASHSVGEHAPGLTPDN